MKNRISKLLEVKSLITIATTAAFVYLSITNEIKPEQFLTIFTTIITTIIAFYFGTQATKDTNNKSDKSE